jgi:hypothetical protein
LVEIYSSRGIKTEEAGWTSLHVFLVQQHINRELPCRGSTQIERNSQLYPLSIMHATMLTSRAGYLQIC